MGEPIAGIILDGNRMYSWIIPKAELGVAVRNRDVATITLETALVRPAFVVGIVGAGLLFHAQIVVLSASSPANHTSLLSCWSQPKPLTESGNDPVFSTAIVAVLYLRTCEPVMMYAMRGWLARLEKVKQRSRSGCHG